MFHPTPRSSALAVMLAGALATISSGCASRHLSGEHEETDSTVAKNLGTFDDLDFNVFSNRDWKELHRSHTNDIKVHWPDGHITTGIEKHIEDLDAMFVYAPDTKIKVHPVKFGSGDWTCVIGTMEGTFTQPMPTPDGKTIAPTNRPFKLPMCTVGHWNKDGLMDEEYLFWDNQTYMKQLGLAAP